MPRRLDVNFGKSIWPLKALLKLVCFTSYIQEEMKAQCGSLSINAGAYAEKNGSVLILKQPQM